MKIAKMQTEEQWNEIVARLVSGTSTKCTRCGNKCIRRKKGCKIYRRCFWKYCKHEESIFRGTIFEEARMDYVTILKIVRLWFSKVHIGAIAELTGVDSDTVTSYLKKAVKLIESKYYSTLPMIGGPGVIVEVDESKFGKRKYHRGHKVDGAWVLGMTERTPERRIVLVVVPDRKAETLISFMKRFIHPDSVIYSDCWKGYNTVNQSFNDHMTVNHSVSFVDFITGVHTNTIEGNWSGLKQGVPVQCRTKERIVLYLLRYMFKRNSQEDPFIHFIKVLFSYLFLFVVSLLKKGRKNKIFIKRAK